jgi:ABC-2 type transport system ATP-binding protein
MTVEEFLRFAASVRGFRGRELSERVGRAIERVNLGSVRRQSFETLSKGYKRRTGLAQAILHDPPILVLDEPTDGLDPNQKHEVRQLIRELGGERAVVLSTHILEEVEAVCTRAVIINRGEIKFDGTPAELDARVPAGVTRNRLDHAFRTLTTSDVPEAGRRKGAA